MSSLSIAIIEDEIAHFSLMNRAIARAFSPVEVHHFENAAGCLKKLDEITPDIIISDYLMPGMNGIEFLEILNQNGKNIPVIIITGQGAENIAVRAMKLGAWDYLVKSSDFFTLLPSVIKKVLREKETKDSLQEAEEKYRLVVDNASEGILVEQDEMLKFINPKVTEHLGYKLEELTLRPLTDFVYPDDKPMVAEYRLKVINGNERSLTCDFRIISRDGEIKWLRNNAVAINWEGRPASLNFVSDITEQKHAEERIYSLTHELIRAQEHERTMISRELHDTTLQDLVALKLKCDIALGGQAKEHSDILQQTITSLRNLAYDLHPPGLRQWGLVKTLDNYCRDFSGRTEADVHFSSAGMDGLALDPETEINLYRLVQEGLNNIKKHADATNVAISLVAAYPQVVLTIEDNGKGFDVEKRQEALTAEKRMGLRSMKERVSLLGGEMNIESYPGKGTKILMRVPSNGESSGVRDI